MPTGLETFDTALNGGIPPISITEIVGAPGSGKSQFCLSLAINAFEKLYHSTRPDGTRMTGSVIYIDTEGSFEPSRLVKLAKTRDYAADSMDRAEDIAQLARSVSILTPTSVAEMNEALDSLADIVSETHAVLIIVDSITALVKNESEFPTSIARQQFLRHVTKSLKYIADTYSIPIVVTNHVTKYRSGDANGDQIVAASLGTYWTHSVNTRFFLEQTSELAPQLDLPIRKVMVIKSPFCGPVSSPFVVSEKGIVGLRPTPPSSAGSSSPPAMPPPAPVPVPRQRSPIQPIGQLQKPQPQQQQPVRAPQLQPPPQPQQQRGRSLNSGESEVIVVDDDEDEGMHD